MKNRKKTEVKRRGKKLVKNEYAKRDNKEKELKIHFGTEKKKEDDKNEEKKGELSIMLSLVGLLGHEDVV